MYLSVEEYFSPGDQELKMGIADTETVLMVTVTSEGAKETR